MSFAGIVVDTWLPWWAVFLLLAAALAIGGYLLVRRASGAWWRLALLVLLLLAVIDPRLAIEERSPLPDIALLIEDDSESQGINDRGRQQAAAVDALARGLEALPDLEVRRATIPQGEEGTLALPAIRDALAGIDAKRFAGAVLVTDGQVQDLGETPPFAAPLHVLLTGAEGEIDRALDVEGVPAYAVVGEPITVRATAIDRGGPETDRPATLTVRLNDEVVATQTVRTNEAASFPIDLERPGENVVTVEVEAKPGEVSTLNNRRYLMINGIRDRLRVLLVSGQPYPGLRVWRNVLKADPTIDLVHFTILRPPEKQDGTPINELALIAFPSRELFEQKLDGFDLVIFDRYARRGLLPLVYLDNVARYVERGGALLEAAGPEFAMPTSLYRTPLARVLPGRPTGEVIERRIVPAVTDLGHRHPVTEALVPPADADADAAPWGPWYRQIAVEAPDGQVLMQGAGERPLLVLERVGEGRVAQLLSDHAWLWAKGIEGGGPHVTLLRRVLHWLMREPELEEERILAKADGDDVVIERHSLNDAPATVRVERPDGTTAEVALNPGDDGWQTGRVAADQPGFYRVTDGERGAYVEGRPLPLAETADLRTTDARLADVAAATGGGVRWLNGEVPALRKVGLRSTAAGSNWLGLRANGETELVRRNEGPLLPPPVTLVLLAGIAAAAWWREGRG